VDFI